MGVGGSVEGREGAVGALLERACGKACVRTWERVGEPTGESVAGRVSLREGGGGAEEISVGNMWEGL